MSNLIYDLVILAILLFFAIWGLRRGLIRSLLSLVSALVALIGALIISNTLAPVVSGWLQPLLEPTVISIAESALPQDLPNISLSADQLLQTLQQAELPAFLKEVLANLEGSELTFATNIPATEELAVALAGKLANAVAYIGLFIISFVLILLLWKLLTRTLDIVAKLPGLHFLNKLGGFLFGAVRGAILLFVCAWLIRWLWSDLIPADTLAQTKLLHFFMTVNPLDYLAKL